MRAPFRLHPAQEPLPGGHGPAKIFVLGEREIDEARRLLDIIERHASTDDWNSILFAALQRHRIGDAARADELLLRNIDDGFSVALHQEIRRQLQFGRIDVAGLQGVVIRDFKEPDALKRATKDGIAEAQYLLGLRLCDSTSINEKNPGVIWLARAAELGHSFARCRLASLFPEADSRRMKDIRQLHAELEARKDSSSEALCCLGLFHAEGFGVDKDPAHAMFWYRKAAEQGLKGAKKALARLDNR